ncbi:MULTISPECIES: ATP synthase subunit B family protein [Caproicibacterium]|uniref:ATPase n=1 Tax=Caproicibacterium argilliputei TaxID=3030016 RepID=A0AA97H1D6_9FIRM|nr:ATPase [Caproicibacterium argilliputei]WOC31217.1 ATPase [Caproicibacterium argilliputei]
MSEANTVNAEDLIDELYVMLEKAWNLPLGHGRAVVDANEARQVLDELRECLPNEIREARSIVGNREKVLAGAKKEAESIVHDAEERAKVLLNQEVILQQARKQADELIVTTQKQTRDMRHASSAYVEDLMQRADEGLTASLSELRSTRQNLKAATMHKKKAKH